MVERGRRCRAEMKITKLAVLVVLIGAAMVGIGLTLPNYMSDWGLAYYPAVRRWLGGQSPYDPTVAAPFVNAPWILPVLTPLALLPMEWGHVALFYLNLGGYILLLRKLKAGKLATVAFLLSPPVVTGLIGGQIDGLLSLGFVLPPAVGLFFIAAKPQLGMGLAIYWFMEKWKNGGWKAVVRTFGPVGLVMTLSLWIFPDWLPGMTHLTVRDWNTSLWPRGLVIGLVLLVWAIRNGCKGMAISSSVFFAPYLAEQSWSAGLIGLTGDGLLVLAATIGMWIVFVIR